MKKYFLKIRAFTLMGILVFVASCSGQVKTDLSNNSDREQKILALVNQN